MDFSIYAICISGLFVIVVVLFAGVLKCNTDIKNLKDIAYGRIILGNSNKTIEERTLLLERRLDILTMGLGLVIGDNIGEVGIKTKYSFREIIPNIENRINLLEKYLKVVLVKRETIERYERGKL